MDETWILLLKLYSPKIATRSSLSYSYTCVLVCVCVCVCVRSFFLIFYFRFFASQRDLHGDKGQWPPGQSCLHWPGLDQHACIVLIVYQLLDLLSLHVYRLKQFSWLQKQQYEQSDYQHMMCTIENTTIWKKYPVGCVVWSVELSDWKGMKDLDKVGKKLWVAHGSL